LLYFVGRRDRMIKTQGFRVAPDEIADVLLGSGQVQEAVVDGEPDAERGQRIVAFVVLSETACVDQVHAYCLQELPKYMQPHRIECCSELPRLASGKYDLSALRAQRSAAAPAP
jgi:acyl-coenzyme A synthetase/AMP-(fatty) acid ligase